MAVTQSKTQKVPERLQAGERASREAHGAADKAGTDPASRGEAKKDGFGAGEQ